MSILIKGGKVVDPINGINERVKDVLIKNGRIEKVANKITSRAQRTIDAKGKYVVPGLIDMHVHLREPGREDKETIRTGTRAAAKGGITSVVAMTNTDPSADSPTVLEYIQSIAAKEGVVNVYPAANITQKAQGEHLAEIGMLKKYGAVALTDDGVPVNNANVMRRALEYASMFKLPILSHTQDHDLSGEGVINEGAVSTKLGLPGQPAVAETAAIAREIALAEYTGHHVHFSHVSTEASIRMIEAAKKRNIPVSAEVCPHYFILTENDIEEYGAYAIMQPPLRTEKDRKALVKAIQKGVVDVIASDHAPHLLSDKYHELHNVDKGIVGLETMVSLTLDRLVNHNLISMQQFVELLSVNPAKILNLSEQKGHLTVGTDADITLIDPKEVVTVDASNFESKGRNTPFDGWELTGAPTTTIVGGKVVYHNGKVSG